MSTLSLVLTALPLPTGLLVGTDPLCTQKSRKRQRKNYAVCLLLANLRNFTNGTSLEMPHDHTLLFNSLVDEPMSQRYDSPCTVCSKVMVSKGTSPNDGARRRAGR